MYIALQIAAGLAYLSEPFLPFTSEKLKGILQLQNADWNFVSENDELLAAGSKIEKGSLLFEKIEDTQIDAQLAKLEATKKSNSSENEPAEPQKETIQFDDFTKLDIRVGTILEAEKMPKTKKLMKLKVDVGIDVRTIVSGIAEYFNPEEIIGQKVTVLVNLAPRNLRGVDSHGMILMTEDTEGKLTFIEPGMDHVKNGESIS